ncbi:MAG: hypothetical protein MUQ68_02575 [Crocinitomicaceae bacterium]|jgi:hypothetical protein|nr:hypothetical protein [Crocinitomicaceae bacterium]
MKYFVLLIVIHLTASSHIDPNTYFKERIELQNNSWKLDGQCLETENEDGFILNPYLESNADEIASKWGYYISFTENTFQTSYRARCGVDCFTSVSGTYLWVGSNKIEFFVSKISRGKYCPQTSETPNKSFGIYELKTNGERIFLERI